MVQEVEAFGKILEFPDGMHQDDIAKAIRNNEHLINPDWKQSEGFGGLASSVVRGAKNTARNVRSAVNAGIDDRSIVEDLAKESQVSGVQQTPIEQQKLQQELSGIDREQGIGGQIADTLKTAARNPMGTGQMIVEQLPNSAVSLGSGYAGFKTGAAAGSAFGPVGATIGGTLGFLGGMFLGNTLLETGSKAIEKASDEDGFTPEERDAALREGATKGAVITGVDAATLKLGGMLTKQLGKTAVNAGAKAEAKVLMDAGVDMSSTKTINAALKSSPELFKQARTAGEVAAARALSRTKKAGILGTGLALETAGEGVGEYAGEYAATGKPDAVDATIEALAGASQSTAETAYNYNKLKAGYRSPKDLQNAADSINKENLEQGLKDIGNAQSVDEAIQAANNTVQSDVATKSSVLESVDPTLKDLERLTGIKPEESPLNESPANLNPESILSQPTEQITQPGAINEEIQKTNEATRKNSLLGNDTEIVLPDGSSVPAKWSIVDADSVKASLKEGINQPRDRSRASSDIQIQGIANNPDYRRLSDSVLMDTGSPTISYDGLIVGGNGRFEGVSRAHDINSAVDYVNKLKLDAANKGINPDLISGIKKPVLVRQITQPVDTRKLAVASNSGTSLQYSGLELAKIDADRMKGIEYLDITENGDIALTGNNFQKLKQSLGDYSAAELSALVDKNGALSQDGVKRVRNALLAKSYGSSDTLSRMIESTDSDMRNVLGSLTKASGDVAKAKAHIDSGAAPKEMDPTDNLLDAVETLAQIRSKGQPLDNYLAQQGMFGDNLDADSGEILQYLHDNIRSQKKLTEFLRNVYGQISNVDQSTNDIFGDNITPTKKEIINNAKPNDRPEPAQQEFFAAKKPTESDKQESKAKTDNVKRDEGKFSRSPEERLKDADRAKTLEKKLNAQGFDFKVTAKDVRGFTNGNRTKEAEADAAEKIAKIFGRRIVWIDAKGEHKINGVVVPSINDTIFIDVNSDKAAHAVMGHEYSHHLEADNPAVYKDLLKSLDTVIKGHDEYAKKYGIEGVDKSYITKEIVGDIIGDNFTNPEFWNRVAEANPSSFARIAETIKKWLNNLLLKARSRGLGSEQWVTDAKKAQEIVADAIAKYKPVATGIQNDSAKFSNKSDSNLKPLSKRKQEQLKDEQYISAVESGDLETAQKMVDQSAVDKGYISGNDYRMIHQAPNREDYNLATIKESGIVPYDYWTHPHYYQSDSTERESFNKVNAAIDRQKRTGRKAGLTVYRAVPKDVKDDNIRNGDWVSPSREYAKGEGESIPGGYRIISAIPNIDDLWWDANSINELGYDDGKEYAYKNTKNNRKLIDAVTYDDEGNVIPVSKRFNQKSDDVRFSRSSIPETISVDGVDRTTRNSNGKLIHPTEEGIKNFWRWFSGSKTTDKNGRPKVFYHGTPDMSFDIFRPETYFAESGDIASIYTGTSASSIASKAKQDNAQGVYPVYIKMDNPFDTRKSKIKKEFDDQYFMKYGTGTPLMDSGLPDWNDARDLAEWIDEEGKDYDGLILDEGGLPQSDGSVKSRGFSYVPLKGKSQVKSAIGNDGSFSSDNDDIRFSFAGPSSKTANKRSLITAQQRLRNGDSPDTVRKETGWYIGKDGKARYEINDSDSKWIDGYKDKEGKLSNFINHDALFSAYPDLANIKVSIDFIGRNENPGGHMSGKFIEVKARDANEAKSILLHEIQHGIQKIEGFATGGNSKEIKQTIEYKNRLKAAKEAADNYIPSWTSLPPETDEDAIAHDLYRKLYGETEARNVQTRMNMSESTRKEIAPERTEDIPADDIIIMFNGKEMESAPPPSNIPDETRFQKLQRLIQDSFNRFTVIKEWLAKRGINLTEQADVYAAEERYHAKVANQLEDFREHERNPLIEKISKAGFTLTDVSDYLLAQHASEANAQIQKINKDPDATAYGITDQEAQEYLDKAPKELGKLANELRDITEQTKELRLKNGLINKDITDAWENTYKFYVPVKGDETKQGTGKGLKVNVKNKRRLGHNKRDEAVIENIFMDHERAIMEVEKNRVGKHLVMMAAQIGMPELMTIGKPEKRKVLKNQTAYEVQVKGVTNGAFDTMQEAQMFKKLLPSISKNISPGDITINQSTDQRVIASASPMLADNEVNVYMDGHAIRIQINDELLARAYTKMGIDGFGKIVAAGRMLNGYLSKVYTGYNPEFIITNIVRDFSSGTINLTGEQGIKMAAKTIKNYPSSFAMLMKYAASNGKSSNKWIDSYRKSGGNTGAAYLSDMERLGDEVKTEYASYLGVMKNLKNKDFANASRAAGRKVFNATLKWIYNLNQAGENAMRLSAYRAMIDSGKTVNEAAKVAKNITVNFNRKGELGSEANAAYLFFNASMQGVAASAHALAKGKNKKQAWSLATTMATIGYLAASALGGGDEDEYDKLNDATKERNVVIKSGDGWVKIPIPYGYGFFWNLGRAIADGQRKDELGVLPWHVASSAIEELTPFGDTVVGQDEEFRSDQVYLGILPTVLKIPAQPIFNKHLFSGSEVMPESAFDKSQPDREKMWRGTQGTMYDHVAGWLDKGLGADVSPETLKYLTRTFTGGAGAFADSTVSAALLKKEGAELDPGETPFIRKAYTELTVKDSRAAFYKARDEARTAAEEFRRAKNRNDLVTVEKIVNDKQEMLALDKFANSLSKVTAAIRDEQDAIRLSDDYTVAEKRLRIKLLEQQEEELYDQYLDVFKIDKMNMKARN